MCTLQNPFLMVSPAAAFPCTYWFCRLEAKIQAIDDRTQGLPAAAPISQVPDGPASLGVHAESECEARKLDSAHYLAASTRPQASGISTRTRQLQAPRQRMLQTYKQLFFDVVPGKQMLDADGPVAEATQRRNTVRFHSPWASRDSLRDSCSVHSVVLRCSLFWPCWRRQAMLSPESHSCAHAFALLKICDSVVMGPVSWGYPWWPINPSSER